MQHVLVCKLCRIHLSLDLMQLKAMVNALTVTFRVPLMVRIACLKVLYWLHIQRFGQLAGFC